MNPKEN